MDYFEISVETEESKRIRTWWIEDAFDAAGGDIDFDEMYGGVPWSRGEIRVRLAEDGDAMPFDMLFTVAPLVNEAVLAAIRPLLPKDAQLIPARVKGRHASAVYHVVNFLNVVDCVDVTRADYVPWEPDEIESWSNPLGHWFERAAIHKDRVSGVHFFRLKNWGMNRLFVSAVARDALLGARTPWLRFNPVID